MKHVKSVEGTVALGLPENSVQAMGFYVFIATVLYIIPRTAIYGILFLIAYLGAAAGIMYLNKPAELGLLFPVTFAFVVVLAEYLQNISVRNMLSLK